MNLEMNGNDTIKTKKPPLIILTGPTAVGKTELSIELAKKMNGEIISADSVQIYKGMDIGSAKVTEEERQGITHYLIDMLNPDEEFNVFRFKQMAQKAMNEIYRKGKLPIIAGGTGFYIQSILYNIQFEENNDNGYRDYYENLVLEKGKEYVYERLKEVDPEYAMTVHFNNIKRVIRALEYFKQTGQKFSAHNKEQLNNESPYDFLYFVLNRERNILYERINKRVDIMIEQGLVKEVEHLKALGYGRELVSMQGLGYKEIASYFDGEISLQDAIDLIKQSTRRFAKRQLTWFRREKEATFINYEDYGNDTKKMLDAMILLSKDKDIQLADLHRKGHIDGLL